MTGFEKRNKARRQKAIEKVKEIEREIKTERRRNKRRKIKDAVTTVLKDLEKVENAKSSLISEEKVLVSNDGESTSTTTVIIESF